MERGKTSRSVCMRKHFHISVLVLFCPSTCNFKHNHINEKLSGYCNAGNKGEKKYSSYSFLTSALEEGERSVSHPWPRFTPGEKDPQYPLDRRLGDPHSWSGHRLKDKSFASDSNRTLVVPSVDVYICKLHVDGQNKSKTEIWINTTTKCLLTNYNNKHPFLKCHISWVCTGS
jgi:hypothetical protein